jgi:membrane-associated phospholipid phosphatase
MTTGGHIVRRSVALVLFALATVPTVATGQRSDSTSEKRRRPPVITWVDAGTLGVGLAGSIALMGVDGRIARRLQEDRYQGRRGFQDVSDIAAAINEKSLFAAGIVTYGIAKLVDAPRTTTDIAWHTTESIFIASATATVIRGALGRSRPFVTLDTATGSRDPYDYKPGKGFSQLAYRAYPSIHAASAFATAAAITAETALHSRKAAYFVGPLSYGIAALPGLARMYKDKHWASDVAMGAALGAVSGWATVRYHHHRPNNKLDRKFIGTMPTPIVANGEVGLAWGLTF